MFFGTNPGGDHTRADVHDPWLPFRRSDWSSYLDDDWGGSVRHALQRAVRSVAALIAGGDENGVELLRKSPAGNFIPFRSRKPRHLPSEIRKKGLRFGLSLITLAQPRTLILLSSNVDLWKSLMEWTGHRPEPDWQSYLGANFTFREAIRSAVDFPRFVFALPGVNTRTEGRNHEVIDLLRRRLDHHGLLPGAGMRTASGPGRVASMTRRKLPLGVQTFRKIREENRYYVDKTGYAARLVEEGDHYFLSRPRRFGKSLFVDTLKELFEGNEPLFRGLAVPRPVGLVGFVTRWCGSTSAAATFKEPGYLHEDAAAQLAAIERRAGVAAEGGSAPVRFRRLLEELHRRTGRRVVVLVDEYDKPILDAIEAPATARANRDYLRGLYSVTKTGDAHIRFSFLTGVSRFSKVSLFSGLNNPTDLTLDPAFSAICGLHRGGSGHGVRTGAARSGPRANPPVVQRLQLARRGAGIQPLRHPPAPPHPPLPAVLVRDRHAGVPCRDPDRETDQHPDAGPDAGRRRTPVELRRGKDGPGSAAVPDRLPDDPGRGTGHRRHPALPPRLSEPRGAAEPEQEPAGRPGASRRHARTRTRGCRICFAPTTSRPSGRGWSSCSTPSPTSGIRGTRSRATKAITQACSTPGWRPRGWT